MKRRLSIKEIIAALLLVLSAALCAFAVRGVRESDNIDRVASRVERVLSNRLNTLEDYVQKATQIEPSQWLEIGNLPSDMVIYRYVGDSLQSWVNRFSTNNDAIEGVVLFQRLTARRMGASPLAEIGDTLSYCNIGPKWYLAKRQEIGGLTYIFGLEVVNNLAEGSFTGANPRLKLGERYAIRPLSFSGGTAVVLEGHPQFKVLYESLSAPGRVDVPMLWLSLICFLVAALLFLLSRPSLKRCGFTVAAALAVMVFFYFWGRHLTGGFSIFSPILFAAGRTFYSLGGLILLGLMMCFTVWCLFICRQQIFRRVNSAFKAGLWAVLMLLGIVAVVVFTYIALRSISLNSNICLELYKIKDLDRMSVLVYAMALMLLLCVPMLACLMHVSIYYFTGSRGKVFAIKNRVAFAVLVAGFLVAVTARLGFQKENSSLEVWANRLAINRDIALEMQLQVVEDKIASDPMIASLSVLDNAESTIRNRLSEVFLANISQDYDLEVQVNDFDIASLRSGENISAQSRFVYNEGPGGLAEYSGLFLYRIENYGISRVLVTVERKGDWRYRGYSSIIGATLPGEVLIPTSYSFARYRDDKLVTFKGNFAYPVQMDRRLKRMIYDESASHLNLNGFIHFVYRVSEDEIVLVSRHKISTRDYAIAVIFLALVAFAGMSAIAGRRKGRRAILGQTYFQTRLTWVILLSLILTLVTMAIVSVLFVYNRNEANRNTLMSEKINSIQSSITSRIRGVHSDADLRSQDVLRLIEDVGNSTNSDVSIYDSNGMIMMSTASALFDRMILDWRMDGEAFNNIMNRTSRYYIQKERIGRHRYYSMYAPLVSEDGEIVATICSPYTDENYDFETNAINHLVLIFSVFALLVLCALFMSKSVLQRMFKPLVEMSRKMDEANLDALEHIEYDKEDEVSGLVKAYNRMVDDLSESSRQLAQAERDKAWSGMARQVAHEIKNPLTPMKLQIQRIMRLKANDSPGWEDKMDEVSKVLLDHIDILTETANEFSTFAKLYTEEPTQIDLDKVLQEEISMFDNRDNIDFEYIGMTGATVMAPKPQLTRVFVNLINNSVQALEDYYPDKAVSGVVARGTEDLGRGSAEPSTPETEDRGRIIVSLRNSTKDGYYDIVVEDNGPGVAAENVEKLFTPNFTTKSAGSGLGLAISRSILQKCDATISYSKSFTLGGACFTIQYPKG